MNALLTAIQFLTFFPAQPGRFNEKNLGRALIYFPVVGLILGLILSGINHLFLKTGFEKITTDIALIVFLAVLTRGLHLDATADTFDAFLSNKKKDEMLQIMRDPHTGVMGAIGIFCVILLKIAFLSSVQAHIKVPSLILMCVISRWAMVMMMFFFPYARKEGKAKYFIRDAGLTVFSISTIITLLITGISLQIKGILIFVAAAVCVYLIGKFSFSKIEGITGDTIGATNEIIEIVVLFCAAALV